MTDVSEAEVEAAADAIDEARYQHPTHPRERPRPFSEADGSDREYAARLARAAITAAAQVRAQAAQLSAGDVLDRLRPRTAPALMPIYGATEDTPTTDPADNPQWEQATRVHDWRNYVPEEVRAMWGSFSCDQRRALQEWAYEMSTNENWE